MAAAGCAVVTEVATGGWKKMFPGQKLLASCQPSQACRLTALQLWVSCVGLECAGCRGLRHIVGWYQTSTGVPWHCGLGNSRVREAPFQRFIRGPVSCGKES